MLQEVFYWLFNMSIMAILTGLPVLFLRRIRKLPKRLTLCLWSIPFLRMAIPVGMNSPISFMHLLNNAMFRTVVVYQPAKDFSFSAANSVQAASTYYPITYKVQYLERVFAIAAGLWLFVTVLLLLFFVISYVQARHEMRHATHWKGNIYLSPSATTPSVIGILKPKIVLPFSYRNRELELVILHEQMHIRSLDNLWRLLALLIATVHWFNPFSWIYLKAFYSDLELSCDERVLLRAGTHRTKEYASLLLTCRQETGIFHSAFGGAKLRARIEHILTFRKMSLLSMVVFLLLLGFIFVFLLTNAP